ncbi:MAG: hypothetical protein QM783_00480 [Phycisphaerales bacterium]
MKKVLMLSVVSLLPVAGLAQVVTPVPPASPAAPAWTPPAPPVTPPPVKPAVDPASDPDIAAPDIVKLDAEGHVVWPAIPPELVVFEAIPVDAAQRAAWGEKWQARQAQMDAVLCSNVTETLRIYDALAELGKATDWQPAVALASPLNKSFGLQPQLEQYIRTSQVLRPKQLAAYNDGLKNFTNKYNADLLKRAEDNQTKVLGIKTREAALQRAQEGSMAFERMAAALADNWAKVKGQFSLSGDFAAGEKLAAEAKDAKGKAAAGIALLRAVPAERQSEVLGAFKTPAPAVKTPADPGVQGVDIPKPPVKK